MQFKHALISAAAAAAAVTPVASAYLDPVPFARTSFRDGNVTFPTGYSFNSTSFTIDEARRFGVVGTSSATRSQFLGSYAPAVAGGSATAGSVFDLNDGMSDPVLNGTGDMVWRSVVSNNPGVFVYDPVNGSRQVNRPLGTTGIDGLGLADGGTTVGGRLNFGSGNQGVGTFAAQTSGTPAFTSYAVNTGIDGSSPYSFVYTPDFARTDMTAAFLVDRGSTANRQVLRVSPSADGPVVQPIADSSQYTNFSNQVAISPDGTKVTFSARLTGETVSSWFLYDTTTDTTTRVAQAGVGPVGSALDFFRANVNDLGQVVFRGTDTAGGNSVFVYDGLNVRRLLGRFDQVDVNGDSVSIGRADSSGFQSGAPQINNLGDVVYSFQYFRPGVTTVGQGADGVLYLVSVVPEPASAGTMVAAGLFLLRRRR